MVWGSMGLAQFIFVLVNWIVWSQQRPPEVDFQPTSFFGLLALFLFAGSYLLKRKVQAQGPGLRLAFTAQILAWALCEAIALLGFVSFFGGHSWLHYLPFVALALLGWISHAPLRLGSAGRLDD
jgi:drug/metabolite transporter (DMT)-like permease